MFCPECDYSCDWINSELDKGDMIYENIWICPECEYSFKTFEYYASDKDQDSVSKARRECLEKGEKDDQDQI